MAHVVEMTAEEQQAAIATAQKVAAEFDQVGAQHDRENTFPAELTPLFKESGLAGLNVPKRFGGWGADIWTTARCVQELAKGDPSCALAFNMHIGVIGFFAGMLGTRPLLAHYLRLTEGKRVERPFRKREIQPV